MGRRTLAAPPRAGKARGSKLRHTEKRWSALTDAGPAVARRALEDVGFDSHFAKGTARWGKLRVLSRSGGRVEPPVGKLGALVLPRTTWKKKMPKEERPSCPKTVPYRRGARYET